MSPTESTELGASIAAHFAKGLGSTERKLSQSFLPILLN